MVVVIGLLKVLLLAAACCIVVMCTGQSGLQSRCIWSMDPATDRATP